MKKLLLFFLLAPFFVPQSVDAQSIPIGDPFETYLRIFPLADSTSKANSHTIRPISTLPGSLPRVNHPWQDQPFFNKPTADGRFRYSLINPTIFTSYNSNFALGQNDGALWQGRGGNYSLAAGVFLSYGPLEIIFRPEVGYSRNRDFELSPLESRYNEYGFAFYRASPDNPQRFGDESLSWFHPGQSTIQLQHWNIAIGFSSANMWMGPSMHNPLILSNNAPGFYHAFIGTTRPVSTPVGSFETRVYWGGLQESDWFDNKSNNNLRFATGMLLAYSPSFIPGLTIGGTRTKYQPYLEGGISSDQIKSIFSLRLVGKTDLADDSQMFSFFGRWAFREYGLETYFEWGLNDGRQDARSILLIPEHSRAYNMGFIKRFDLIENRWLTFNFEMTQLEHDRTLHSKSAASGIWYEHSRTLQGWTHRGQLLGSGIGVGSNNQLLRADLYDDWGLAGFSLNRIELHNDKLRRNLSAVQNAQVEEGAFSMEELKSTEFRFGGHAVIFLPRNLELQADIYQSRFINRHNIHGNHDWNTNLSMTLRYQLNGGLR